MTVTVLIRDRKRNGLNEESTKKDRKGKKERKIESFVKSIFIK